MIEYAHDLAVAPERMANADFKTQSKSLMGEMDALRNG